MGYAERVKQKQAYLKDCFKFGFDENDYERAFKWHTKRGYKKSKLIGFTAAGRCILEDLNSHKRDYAFPSETMRYMRLYYDDMAYKLREKKDNELGQTFDKLAKMMTEKMKKAGYNTHPTDIFNVYGSPENAKVMLNKTGAIVLSRYLR